MRANRQLKGIMVQIADKRGMGMCRICMQACTHTLAAPHLFRVADVVVRQWLSRAARIIVMQPLTGPHHQAGQVGECGERARQVQWGAVSAWQPGKPCTRNAPAGSRGGGAEPCAGDVRM